LSPDSYFVIAATIVGLVVGSFLNVLIHRLPKMMEREWRAQCAELEGRQVEDAGPYNLWLPASHCPACLAPLRIRDNIPLASYFLLLKGRCGHCGVRIPLRYPLVEALTAALSAWIAVHFGWGWQAMLALPLVWTLIALTFIDADTTLLPDSLTLPALWLGLLANLNGLFVPLPEAVIGAAAGYLSLWLIYWAFKLATGKEGMGYGDFKLLAALGAWMGWKMLLPIVLISSVVGAVIGLALIAIQGRGRETALPFGPYLAVAGFIALLYGPPLGRLVLGF
jgi:leader peptidase (prepilin peptidase)/N-methyltransferase